jgi:hypothetical protein
LKQKENQDAPNAFTLAITNADTFEPSFHSANCVDDDNVCEPDNAEAGEAAAEEAAPEAVEVTMGLASADGCFLLDALAAEETDAAAAETGRAGDACC